MVDYCQKKDMSINYTFTRLLGDDYLELLLDDLERYRNSFFLSRHWILNWLKHSSNCGNKYALVFFEKEKIAGLAVFNETIILRRKFFKKRILCLFDNAVPGYNFAMEYNEILSAPVYTKGIYSQLLNFLASTREYNEIHLNGLTKQALSVLKGCIDDHRSLNLIVNETSICRKVNLAIFADGDAYFNSLSKNRRAQLRKSIAHYSEYGDITESVAKNTEEAFAYLEELGKLHEKKWNKKGVKGVFSNQVWVNFHRSVIKSGMSDGKIILYKLFAGDVTIGILYIVLDNNNACVIQTGFSFDKAKYAQPGFITHYFFVRHAIKRKLSSYDFLAGDTQYKKSLSNDHDSVFWVVIQRKSMSTRIENFLVKYFRLYRFCFDSCAQFLFGNKSKKDKIR